VNERELVRVIDDGQCDFGVRLPGSGFVGPRIYAWIARKRHRFGGQTQMCTLPDASGSTVSTGKSRRDRA
jgi:predicted DCC family thiol-disulfide oxidoreductase YuxK